LLDEFAGGAQIDVIFRASREEDLVLKAEMNYLANNSGGTMRIHYLVGARKDHPMDAKSLKGLVPKIADSDIYICGPEPLVNAVRKAAGDLDVPKNRFHDESFSYK
jgi:ferredoxin-NADP reductase